MRLASLRVLRTPGIRTPFTLEPETGVNLIVGPNGAGKSSIYRAVLNLLWPGSSAEKPFEAAAVFDHDGRRLAVSRVDLARPVWNGERPDLGPDHLASRYKLGVLDLLDDVEDDDPLVREIRRHMAGGFDLQQVKNDLFTAGTGRSEASALSRAVETVADVEREQRRLAGQQARLEDLRRNRDLAARAGDRQRALENLRSLAGHQERLAQAEEILRKMPAGVANMREDDPDHLARLRRREKDHRQQRDARTAGLADLERRIAGLDTERGSAGETDLGLFRKRHAALVELARDLRQAERDHGKAREAAATAGAAPTPRSGRLPATALAAGVLVLLAGLAGFVSPAAGVPDVVALTLLVLGSGLAGMGVKGLVDHRGDAPGPGWNREKELEAARAEGQLSGCRAQFTEALEIFNRQLAKAGLSAVADVEQAAQVIEDLEARRERLRRLQDERRQTAILLTRDVADLAQVQGEIGDLIDRLSLSGAPSPDAEVARLAELRRDFATAGKERDAARQEILRLEKEVDQDSRWLNPDETTSLATTELERRIAVEKELAAVREPLHKEIATIEAEIKRATGGHDLENALAAAANARAALTDVRENARTAALGSLLVDLVAHDHESSSRPAVLTAAGDFFRLFTGNRYQLKMAAHGGGQDRYQVETSDSARPLDLCELSDGTRAQLLLAVKLAFIASGELDARPPIFLDDSLASADPERFAAVAAGLGRLAQQQQRQIFYLTPDPADVAAWNRALAGAGLPAANLIDLAEVRGLAGAADPRLLDPENLAELAAAPEPADLSAADYAAVVRAPAPDPWSARSDIHLVFLLADDLDLVRRLIDGGAPTLERFGRGREALVAAGIIEREESDRIDFRGKVWRAYLDAWKIGRAAPVPRSFLEESAAVSRTFAERLTDLLATCRGDGRTLMNALREGAVKGFREDKKDQLQQELELAGYLDGRDPLDRDDRLLRTLGGLASPLREDANEVRRMVTTFERLLCLERDD